MCLRGANSDLGLPVNDMACGTTLEINNSEEHSCDGIATSFAFVGRLVNP